MSDESVRTAGIVRTVEPAIIHRRRRLRKAVAPSVPRPHTLAPMRRTKIVATIGPASRDRKVLESLAQAGIDVVRLNFSHGEHHEHLAVIAVGARDLRRTWAGRSRSCRTSPVPRSAPAASRTTSRSSCATASGSRSRPTSRSKAPRELISTTYDPLPRDVSPGDRILLDDGNLELRVIRPPCRRSSARWWTAGWLKSKKGMNLPGREAVHARPHGEGPPRPRLRREERRRLRGPVVRPPGLGRHGVQGPHQDRWAAPAP